MFQLWNAIHSFWDIPINNITIDVALPQKYNQEYFKLNIDKAFKNYYWIDSYHFQIRIAHLKPYKKVSF
jgi:hypothetical protein